MNWDTDIFFLGRRRVPPQQPRRVPPSSVSRRDPGSWRIHHPRVNQTDLAQCVKRLASRLNLVWSIRIICFGTGESIVESVGEHDG